LGWEFVLALVTLLLAAITGWLAWTTRRLARATAEEVQGQTRPVVVPTGDPIQVGPEQPDPDQEGKPPYPGPGAVQGERRGSFNVTVPMRNIGVGPALNLEGSVVREMYGTNRITALPPGESADVGINISMFNEGAHPFMSRINTLLVTYADLAGRQFTTDFSWMFPGFAQEANLTYYLHVSSGVLPDERQRTAFYPDYANPLQPARGRFWPTRYAVGQAWHTNVVQAPGEAPLPFHTRLHTAWRELFPKRSSQRFQRLAWSVRVYRATREKPIPYRLPRLLHRPYRIARGWKWATLTYVRMR